MIAILWAVWGALWWRLRGSSEDDAWIDLPGGGQVARIVCAAAIAAPAALTDPLLALLLWLALFTGMVAAGWGDAMDIGRIAGQRMTDAALMAGWGLVAVAPAAALAWWWGGAWLWLAVAGLAFGPIYALLWWVSDVRGLPAVPRLAAGPTEWGEVVAGAMIGAALACA